MSIQLTANHVHLQVPNYVQRKESGGGWLSMLYVAATSGLSREHRTLLSDIDFKLAEGDRLAMLGANGAGKTTLLRVLAGSLQPTRGSVEVSGSRQALLNLGLGFLPEATVKENIYLRGTAMGLKPAQIRALVGSILEFAELSHVASHRLATLSSGQRMRLGFSVSTSVQNDIMLLDEWFGAGDSGFVKRARERMSDRVNGSKIVVLASHNLGMLRKVCNVALVMEQGKVSFFGPVDDAIDAYKSIYQSTEEYVAGRKLVEEQADRIVRRRLAELEREKRAELQGQREEYAALIVDLKQQKKKLGDAREEVRGIRERLEARELKLQARDAKDSHKVTDGK